MAGPLFFYLLQMRKITILNILLFSFITLTSVAQQPVFHEDFEQGIPSSFSLFDLDGLTPHLPYPESQAWTAWIDPEDEDNKVAASLSYYTPAGSADDWMVLPLIEMPDDTASCHLYWRSRSAYDTYKDGYFLMISEESQSSPEQLIKDDISNSWKTILQVPNYNNPATWNTFEVNLSDYAGKQIYVAFVNKTYDGWMLFVDDITIGNRESVKKGSVKLTTDLYAMNGKALITANVKAGILDPLKSFTARLISEEDTVSEKYTILPAIPQNTKYSIELENKLSGTPGTIIDYKLELVKDSIVFAADSGKVVFLTTLQGKKHIIAEGLINSGPNGGYGPKFIEGYKLAEQKYGDAFIGIEVHGPNYSEDKLTVAEKEDYLLYLMELQGKGYGQGVIINRLYNGDVYVDIDSLCEIGIHEPLICTATANGKSDDEMIDVEADVVFGFPLNESSLKYEWVIVEDSLWATQWNMYSGGLFGPFLGYENLPLDVNICRNGVMRDRITSGEMRFNHSVQADDSIHLQLHCPVPKQVAEPRHLCAVLLISDSNSGEIVNAAKCELTYEGLKPVNGIHKTLTDNTDDSIEYYDIMGNRIGKNKLQLDTYKGLVIIKERKNGNNKTYKMFK